MTITFNTGVAQGSITFLQLFNIFINALLRMLAVTGQNENIRHGLQIRKDQKGDNQRDDNGCQFNNIGSIDDISILADMQKLLNAVQEFAVVNDLTWAREAAIRKSISTLRQAGLQVYYICLKFRRVVER